MKNNLYFINKIYNSDCLSNKGMPILPDKSVDHIIVDLPYGITRAEFDKKLPLDKLWKEYFRVLKDNGVVILFASTPFDYELINSNKNMLKETLIWHKPRATGFLNANKRPLKAHEKILVFSKSKVKKKLYKIIKKNNEDVIVKANKDNYSKIITCSSDTQKSSLHPHQKPVKLISFLLKSYTKSGDIVLDNTIGSGTTAISCIEENRYYIGFEKDKENYLNAIKRIDDFKKHRSVKK